MSDPTADTEAIDGPSPAQLHPAEHRAYRELYVTCRQLTERWRRLATALDDTSAPVTLKKTSKQVDKLLEELEPRTAAFELHSRVAAQGLGARIGDARALVVDRTLDSGAALRFAVLDLEHIVTLLRQLARMAKVRGDEDLRHFCLGWAKTLRPLVRRVRDEAIQLGDDPDRAAAPLDDSAVSQALHKAGWAVGTLGEWIDKRAASTSASSASRPGAEGDGTVRGDA
jgi:hypothetical protein